MQRINTCVTDQQCFYATPASNTTFVFRKGRWSARGRLAIPPRARRRLHPLHPARPANRTPPRPCAPLHPPRRTGKNASGSSERKKKKETFATAILPWTADFMSDPEDYDMPIHKRGKKNCGTTKQRLRFERLFVGW